MTKVEAAKQTLQAIDPDVRIDAYDMNISTVENFEKFKDIISKCDLVLSCVDNFNARMVINQAMLELDRTWMESGVSENAVSGHIQLLIPGANACYQCCPPLVVASGEKEAKREGVCAASLPTTMGIVAGFLSQHTLKYLLDFGDISGYVGYDAMKDHFPQIELKANPTCSNDLCVQRQNEHRTKPKYFPAWARFPEEKKAIVHKANEWGIEVSSTSDGDLMNVAPASGLEYAFATKKEEMSAPTVAVTERDSLDDLAAKMKALMS